MVLDQHKCFTCYADMILQIMQKREFFRFATVLRHRRQNDIKINKDRMKYKTVKDGKW